MRSRPSLAAAAGAFALGLAACDGGGRPSLPQAPQAPETAVAAGTVLSVASGETGEPAAGASVIVAGQAYTADAAGRVVLAEAAALASLVDVISPGMFDRQTVLRSSASTHWTLWPRTSPTGLDEDYTARVAYGWGRDDEPGAAPLYRLSAPRAVLVPSTELRADPEAVAAHHHAAGEVTAGSGGGVTYSVEEQAPAGAVVFSTLVDAEDASCKDRVLAFTSIRLRDEEITGGRIVFCSRAAARDATVTHEAGHTFGLSHSPDPGEVMHAVKMRRQATGFGPRESLVMRLMLQRRGGNRYPDNDRGVTAAGEREVRVICR